MHTHMHTCTSPRPPPPTHRYGYSRDHGSQFQGLGVGAPLSAAYARFLGGGCAWEVGAKPGAPSTTTTTVHLWLPAHGFTF